MQTTAATTALLHRWSDEFARWVPSAAGAATVASGVTETRWDTAGVGGQYCLLCDAAAHWKPMGSA